VSSDPAEGFKGTLLLCDFAQEVGGKLYILGGGFSKSISWGQPVNMALAIKLVLPWHSANHKLKFEVALLTEDGNPVLNDAGQPMMVGANIETGRPPGLTPGSSLDAALALPMFGLQLAHGTYRWELKLEGQTLDSASFEVIAPPPGFLVPSPQPT
jgi:hypothetical protein